MNIQELGRLVQLALDKEPPAELRDYCGIYYDPYYHLLYLLALHTDGACVELGVETGRGLLALGLSGRTVWGIDNNLRLEAKIIAADMKNVSVIEGSSLPPHQRIIEEVGGDISILHVDTEHSFAQAREEFNQWMPHLRPGAVVCFDDTHAMGDDVGRFVISIQRPMIFDDRLHSCGYAAVIT